MKNILKKCLTTYLCIILLNSLFCKNISDEVVSADELQARIKKFNDFYHELNPSSKNLELRVDDKGRISLFTKTSLAEGDTYLKISKEHFFSHEMIFSTKYAEAMMEIQENYGFDDIVNTALVLLAEKFNPNSKWKPYFDILPAKPNNFNFDFWTKKVWAEPMLAGTGLVSK